MTSTVYDPSAITDQQGRRVCATLHPDLTDDQRLALCVDSVGHAVSLAFRYAIAGRWSLRCTVVRMAALDGPRTSRPVMIVLHDGGAHVISLAAIASWSRNA